MTMNSSWAALHNPVFRRLWIASVISGTCVAAHDNAATYIMNTLGASPFLISLMSTVASLPFFLFTLPAGVLADRVNRKKLTCAINVWLAAIAVALSILGWLHLLNPCLILISVFLLGGGDRSLSARLLRLPLLLNSHPDFGFVHTRRPHREQCVKPPAGKSFVVE
jgi:MFS family permease